jgi:hypothetical protein
MVEPLRLRTSIDERHRHTVAFLTGEGGRYITGVTLDINGGMYFR